MWTSQCDRLWEHRESDPACADAVFLAFLVSRIMGVCVADDEGFVLIKVGGHGCSTTRSGRDENLEGMTAS